MDIDKMQSIDLLERLRIATADIPPHSACEPRRLTDESIEPAHRAQDRRQATRDAAMRWCDRETAWRPDTGAAMLNQGLRLLMQQGWGTFRLEQLDLAAGRACIHWRPLRGTAVDRQKDACVVRATIEGWMAGLMDWTLRRRGGDFETACHCKRGLADRNRLRILLLKPRPLPLAQAPGLPPGETPLQ
ncbi:hypothetical protein [Caldimonas tepidiphila]|uniref:hypothetical protein n=1 Tax=Caldimonas tepidiphila TaxID=2315841 RepID=UPI000E5AD85F|nr:hypothetical protein [Caldimonas tepidiphila]